MLESQEDGPHLLGSGVFDLVDLNIPLKGESGIIHQEF